MAGPATPDEGWWADTAAGDSGTVLGGNSWGLVGNADGAEVPEATADALLSPVVAVPMLPVEATGGAAMVAAATLLSMLKADRASDTNEDTGGCPDTGGCSDTGCAACGGCEVAERALMPPVAWGYCCLAAGGTTDRSAKVGWPCC